jgi:folate-binding protein YgfZ
MPTDLALDPVRLARLATGAVLVRVPHAVVEVNGSGAAQCLQGLLTNDLVTPGPEAFHWGALLTPKGMIETDLWSLRRGEDVVLVIPPAGAAKALPVFARSIPPRLAKVQDRSATWAVLLLIGGQSETILHSSALLRDLPSVGKVVAGEDGMLAARADSKTPFAFLLAGPVGAIDAAALRLGAAGAAEGDGEDADAARVLAGWPALGAEIDDKTLPQEVRFDDLGGVSYTKGCYLGQETVARIHFRGHPNRELRGLEWEDAAPLSGVAIEGGAREVGTVRTTLVVGGRRIGLAPIRREVTPGDTVMAGGRPARVVSLPFQEALVA